MDRRSGSHGRWLTRLLAVALLVATVVPVGSPPIAGAAEVAVIRLAGRTRIETAAQISRHMFPDGGVTAVVLACGDDFPDGLAGVPLAHHSGGPLLLTGDGDLPEVTADELSRVLVPGGTVHVLGGLHAIPREVTARIARLGYAVQRHGGVDRYETAVRIARLFPDADTAVVVSGEAFPDALAAGPIAAARGWPILLTARTRLPAATRTAVTSYSRAVVVGGPAAVADDVLDDLTAMGIRTTRVGGATRFDTAIAVAVRYTNAPDVVIASGEAFADALTGGVLAARAAAPVLFTARDALPGPTAARLADHKPDVVRLLGGLATASEIVPDALSAAVRSDAAAPQAVAVDPLPGGRIERLHRVAVTSDRAAPRASILASVGGRPVDGSIRVVADTWELELDPLPPLPPGEHRVRVEAGLTGAGGTRYLVYGTTVVVPPATRRSPEGWTVAPGTSPVVGTGPVTRFTVEVESAVGVDVTGIAFAVEDALFDRRSWTANGQVAFQRVDDPGAARVRIVVATPPTVDRWCAPIVDTNGRYSCWEGRRVMLNSWRWATGAEAFADDLLTYRRHLVNHEVGHSLGHRHTVCPSPGQLAPIMMQQSKGTQGCVPNGWPYP